MEVFAGWFLGSSIALGLAFVTSSLDDIAKEMKRRNQLKEAELAVKGMVPPPPKDDSKE